MAIIRPPPDLGDAFSLEAVVPRAARPAVLIKEGTFRVDGYVAGALLDITYVLVRQNEQPKGRTSNQTEPTSHRA